MVFFRYLSKYYQKSNQKNQSKNQNVEMSRQKNIDKCPSWLKDFLPRFPSVNIRPAKKGCRSVVRSPHLRFTAYESLGFDSRYPEPITLLGENRKFIRTDDYFIKLHELSKEYPGRITIAHDKNTITIIFLDGDSETYELRSNNYSVRIRDEIGRDDVPLTTFWLVVAKRLTHENFIKGDCKSCGVPSDEEWYNYDSDV